MTNHTHTNTHTAKPCKKLSSRGVAKADATNRHLCARIPDPCRVKKTLWSQQHAVCICISYSNCCQQLIEICAVCPSVRHSLLPALCHTPRLGTAAWWAATLSLAVDRWGKSCPAAHSSLVALPPTSGQSYHGPMYIQVHEYY